MGTFQGFITAALIAALTTACSAGGGGATASGVARPVVTLSPDPSSLHWVGPSSLSAGICQAVSVEVLQKLDTPAVVLSPITILLAGAGSDGGFYSDSSCATSITTATVQPGSTSADIYYKKLSAGSVSLNASSGVLTASSMNVQVLVTPPYQLALSGTTPAPAATCDALTVQVQANGGAALTVSAPITATLSDGSSGGTYYSNSGCTSSITSVVVPIGQSTSTVYYKRTAPGTIPLQAASSGLVSGNFSLTLTSIGPTKLSLAGPSPILTSVCSTYTVVTQDAGGATTAVSSSTTVNFTGAGTGGAYYSDSGCTTLSSSLVIAAAASSGTIYYKQSQPGSITLQAAATGLTASTLPVVVASAPVAALSITGTAAILTTDCALFSVNALDAGGNSTQASSAMSITLSGAGTGGAYYSDVSCVSAASTTSIGVGAVSQAIYYKQTTPGTATLQADSTGVTSGTLAITVAAGAPSALVLSGAASITTVSCSPYTVTLKDASANTVNATSATTVTLGGAGTGGAYYSDASCTASSTSLVIASGQPSGMAYYKQTQPGSIMLVAASTGLTSSTLPVTVTSAPITALTLTGLATILTTDCSPYSVNGKDSSGSATLATTALAVTLSGAGTSGAFYSDAACSAAITSTNIAIGASAQTIYYKKTTPGTPTLLASATGPTSGSLAVTVTAGAPSVLSLAGSSTLSTVSCSPYTVTLKDGSANTVNAPSSVTVTFSGEGTGGSYYSDASCVTTTTSLVVATGQPSGTAYYKQTQPGSITLQAASTGLTSSTLAVTVTSAPITALTVTGSNAIFTTDCASYSVNGNDSSGSPTLATTALSVTLSGAGTAGAFYSNATCSALITSTTIAIGASSQAVYYKQTTPGAATPTATATGPTSGSIAVTVSAGAPSGISLTGAASLTTVTCSPYTATLKDASANVTTTPAILTVNLTGAGTNGSFYSTAGCATTITSVDVAAGASAASVYYRKTTPGSVTLSAASTGLTSGTRTVTVIASTPAKLSIADPGVSPSTIACTLLTVSSLDASDNPVNVTVATAVTLGGAGTGGAFYSNATCATTTTTATIALGAGSANFYYKKTSPGAVTLTGTKTGMLGASLALTIVAGPTNKLVFTSATTAINATGCKAIVVNTRDLANNNVNVAADTTLTLTGEGADGAYYSNATCTTALTNTTILSGAGSLSYYYKKATAGSITLSAAATGLTTGTQAFTVSTGLPTQIILSTAPVVGVVGACLKYVAVVQDESAITVKTTSSTKLNLADGSNGAFYSNSGCTTLVTSMTIATGVSTGATYYYKKGTTGSITLTTADNAGTLTSATKAVVISSGAATQLAYSASAASVNAGACSTVYTVQVRDENAQPVTSVGTVINLTGEGADGSYYTNATCTTSASSSLTIAAGNSVSYYYKKVTAGAVTLAAAASGLTGTTKAVTINTVATVLAFNSGATTTTVGTCGAYVIQTRNSGGAANNVAVATTVTLSGAGTGGAFYIDSGCTLPITTATVNASSSSTTVYYTRDQAGAATFDAAASGFTSAALTVTTN